MVMGGANDREQDTAIPRILKGKVFALVTARGQSKELPGKNLRLLAGRPLLVWAIDAARQSEGVDRVLLSTEDREIARVGHDGGAEVPFLRPGELAGDTTTQISVILHVLEWLGEHEGALPEYLLLLQPTSPLRGPEDIDAAIAIARSHPPPSAVISVCAAPCHPYWAQEVLPGGTLKALYPEYEHLRRQDLPAIYIPNGAIYLNRVDSLLVDRTVTPVGSRAYIMPAERSIDIDTPWDFLVADLVMRAKHVQPVT
jgi:CMP-N,N'-diacetyllegionaminic acid synthase